MAKVCGAAITDAVRDGLAQLPPDDKQAVTQFGVELATEQCRGLSGTRRARTALLHHEPMEVGYLDPIDPPQGRLPVAWFSGKITVATLTAVSKTVDLRGASRAV